MADRPALVESVLKPRFRELAAIASEHGRDWAAKHELPEIDETWYLDY